MANPTAERIETLKALVRDLEAEEADRAARERYLASRQKRRNDTRRKMLAGTVVLELAEEHEKTGQWLLQQLDAKLTHRTGRELFGLAVPLKQPPPKPRTDWK